MGFTGDQAEVDAFAQQNPQAVARIKHTLSGTGGGQGSQLPDWVNTPRLCEHHGDEHGDKSVHGRNGYGAFWRLYCE